MFVLIGLGCGFDSDDDEDVELGDGDRLGVGCIAGDVTAMAASLLQFMEA